MGVTPSTRSFSLTTLLVTKVYGPYRPVMKLILVASILLAVAAAITVETKEKRGSTDSRKHEKRQLGNFGYALRQEYQEPSQIYGPPEPAPIYEAQISEGQHPVPIGHLENAAPAPPIYQHPVAAHHVAAVPVPVPQPVPHPVPQPVAIPVAVPVTKHVPVAVPVPADRAVPFPVAVPVPKPYPVHVEKIVHVDRPIAVPVEKPVHIPVDRPVAVPVPVPKPYPVPYEKIVHVDRPYPVHVAVPYHVPKPYPVPVAIHAHYKHHKWW